MAPATGAWSNTRPATEHTQTIVDKITPRLEAKLQRSLGSLKAVSYATQVVAGVNFWIKVRLGVSDEYIHVRVFQDLTGQYSLHAVQEKKTANEPFSGF